MAQWTVEFYEEFEQEFLDFNESLQDEILLYIQVLRQFGPQLGRPYVDTLNGSQYANMKELRFEFNRGVWRVAFAFDPQRKAILLIAGDKSGQPERKFYRRLIKIADTRFEQHLKSIGRD
jgi:hypothetical protein